MMRPVNLAARAIIFLVQCATTVRIVTRRLESAQPVLIDIMIVTFCLIIDLLLFILWRCSIRPQFSVLRDLPQPPTSGSMLLGHVGAVFNTTLGRKITDWMNDVPNDGLLFFRGVLGAEYLVVTCPEALRDVLFTCAYDLEKTSGFRQYTERFLAGGLLMQEGDLHKMRRKAIAPVFQSRKVNQLKPLLCEKSRRLVGQLQMVCNSKDRTKFDESTESLVGEAVVDICDWATRFTLDIAGIVGFGEDFGLVERPGEHPIFQAYTTIFAGSEEKMRHYTWHNTLPAWLRRIFAHGLDRQMDEANRLVKAITFAAVKKRMELISRSGKAPQDFLTEVILSGRFDASECADELTVLMAAAHESTAALIAMTMFRLSQHPDLQSALRRELSDYGLHAAEHPATRDDQYEKMPLLNATLNEMMRLEPPVPLTLRKTVRDTVLANRHVKAGTYIVISPHALGRSRAIWGSSASEFDPLRWIRFRGADGTMAQICVPRQDTNVIKRENAPVHSNANPRAGCLQHHPYSMLTFLKGPKGCTGEPFANAEMRRVIAALIANFECTVAQSHEPKQAGIVVVKPAGGILVKVRPIRALG